MFPYPGKLPLYETFTGSSRELDAEGLRGYDTITFNYTSQKPKMFSFTVETHGTWRSGYSGQKQGKNIT